MPFPEMGEKPGNITRRLKPVPRLLSDCNSRQSQGPHSFSPTDHEKSINIGLIVKLLFSLFLTHTVQSVLGQRAARFTTTPRSIRLIWLCRISLLPQLMIWGAHAKPQPDSPLQFNCERPANRPPALPSNETAYSTVHVAGEGPVSRFQLPHDRTQSQITAQYGMFNHPALPQIRRFAGTVQRPGGLDATIWNGQGLSTRRPSNYRPHLWTQLSLDHCYNSVSNVPVEHIEGSPQHRKRKRRQDHPSHRLTTEPQYRYHGRPMPISSEAVNPQKSPSLGQTSSMQPSKLRPSRRRPNSRSEQGRSYRQNRRQRSTEKDPLPLPTFPVASTDVITVDQLAIRPSVIRLKDGNVKGRLQYVVQLHRRLTGYFRLTVKVWLDTEFLPIYVGVVENICAHWPADGRQVACSLKKPRFYQDGHVCLCHMPPGVYQQRFRFNIPGILDGLHLPRFLVNLLFSGKKLNLHIEVKLDEDNDRLVGCVRVKLPVVLESL